MDEQEIRKAIAEFMSDGQVDWAFMPEYTSDLNAMHLVEQELKRRGKWMPYLEALIPKPQPIYADELEMLFGKANTLWALTHATAEQRARAAYAVISQQKEGE